MCAETAKSAQRRGSPARPRPSDENGWGRLDVSVLSTHPRAPHYGVGSGSRSPLVGVLGPNGVSFANFTRATSPGPIYHVQDKFKYPCNPLWSFARGSRSSFTRPNGHPVDAAPPADLSRAFAACKPHPAQFRFPCERRFRNASMDTKSEPATAHAQWRLLSVCARAPAYSFSKERHRKAAAREARSHSFAAYDAFGPQPFSQKPNAPYISLGKATRAHRPSFFSCDMSTVGLSLRLPHAYR